MGLVKFLKSLFGDQPDPLGAKDEERKAYQVDQQQHQFQKIGVKCAGCGQMFVQADTGQRPLEVKCPDCGTIGKLGSVSSSQPQPQTKGPEPEMKHLECPVCATKFFIQSDTNYIQCPSCGVEGEI